MFIEFKLPEAGGSGIPVILIATVSQVPTRADRATYQLSELAFPLDVNEGDKVSFTINETAHPRYLYATGGERGRAVDYWKLKVGEPEPGQWRNDIAGKIILRYGTWNLTFESSGRIAIVYYLPEMCGWTATTPDLSGVSCPPFVLNETTGFSILTIGLDRSYVLTVEGDVDSYFYDRYLNLIAQAKDMKYGQDMDGVVVVNPRNGSAVVNFTASPAMPRPADLMVLLLPITLVILALIIVGFLVKRRKKKDEGKKTKSSRNRE